MLLFRRVGRCRCWWKSVAGSGRTHLPGICGLSHDVTRLRGGGAACNQRMGFARYRIWHAAGP
jgi:hypothetical protein